LGIVVLEVYFSAKADTVLLTETLLFIAAIFWIYYRVARILSTSFSLQIKDLEKRLQLDLAKN
jgi:hypothetical protein